jgi:hypothetical protein
MYQDLGVDSSAGAQNFFATIIDLEMQCGVVFQ